MKQSKQKNKPKTIKFNKHWGFLAKGYLNLAEQGFIYLQKKEDIGRKKTSPESKAFYGLEDGNMIIASIWNIKHGLELVIKGLRVTIDKKYWEIHDLEFLLRKLENRLKNCCVKKHINLLKLITRKYYRCKFSSKTTFIDRDNTLLKYPESHGFTIDYSFVHDLKRRDIGQFLRDIHNLKRVYDLLEGQYSYFEHEKRLGRSKKDSEKLLMSIPTMKNSGFKYPLI